MRTVASSLLLGALFFGASGLFAPTAAAQPVDEEEPGEAAADEPPRADEEAAADEPIEDIGTDVAAGPAPADVEDVVVTGTRTPESSQRATVRTDLVTRDEAERRGATNVAEALQGQLGVQVNPSAYGMLGNPAAIQIQGLDRDRVLVLEDGERVIGGIDGAIDLSQFPLTDVERIEVVTGPTSSLYGASAIGGVVNILSGPPFLEGPSGRFRLEGRYPWGALAQGNGYFRHRDHWVGVDASAQWADSIVLRDDSQATALPEHQQYLVGLRAGTKLDRHVEVRIKGRWIHDRSLGLVEEDVPGLGAFRIDTPDTTDRFSLHAAEILDLGGGSNLRVTAGGQWVDGETVKDRFESPVDETRSRMGSMHSIETTVTIADGPRTWVAGFRSEVEQFEQQLQRTEVIGGQLVETGHQEVPETMLGDGAVYGQLAYKLHDTFTLLPGVRGELHLHYGPVVAPRLAAAYRPADWITIRASGGRGFRAPAAREFGFYFDHSVFGYNVLGNRDLEPETSWGVNSDVSVKPLRGALLRAGVYANWIFDLIDIDYLSTTPGGVDNYGYQNIAEARTFGAQIDGRYQVTEWFRTEAGYAFTWTRNDTSEQPLVGRPPHTTYAALVATAPWDLEVTVRQRIVTDAFIEENLRTPGFQMLDLRLAQTVWKEMMVYGGVLNLLDSRKDPDRLGDQRPLVGRTFYLGLAAKLPPEE